MAGLTLPAHELRAYAPRTLLFSGTKTIANSDSSQTQVDTLANVLDNEELPWTLEAGELELVDGGLFLVSLTAVFVDNASGNIRRAHIQGSQFGSSRVAPYVMPGFIVQSPTGGHVTETTPLQIVAGETIKVFCRQDSGVSLSATVWLGLTQLPT